MQKIFSYLWTVFLILFMLFILMLGYIFYDGFQEKVSEPKNNYSELFIEIRKDGWNDSNASFTKYIIENGERIVEENHDPITLLNSPPEYQILFSYIQYLESKEEYQKEYSIYVNLFKSFQNMEKSYFNLGSQLIVENTFYKSLEKNFKNNIFPEEMKKSLKKELQKLLIVDKKPLLKAIKYEFNAASNYLHEFH